MANDVFANNLEIACKAADGKSIACFPDVCFTPPSPPAGWIPIPYANTAYAKDTTNASKTVFISGKPIMKKDVSYFKTSTGNESAAGPKGIMTHVKKGKAYFTSWSMNVKIEGKNANRHSDLTTHNHGSSANTAPWFYADSKVTGSKCRKARNKVKKACEDKKTKGRNIKQKKGKKLAVNNKRSSKGWKKEHCGNLDNIKNEYDKKKKALKRRKRKLIKLEKKVAKVMQKIGGMKDQMKKMAANKAKEIAIKAGIKGWLGPFGWAWTAYDVVSAGADAYAAGKLIDKTLKTLRDLQEKILKIIEEAEKLTKDIKKMGDALELAVKKKPCLEARRCILAPYKNRGAACCNGQTAHHIVPNAMFQKPGTRKNKKMHDIEKNVADCPDYSEDQAPCVCVEGHNQVAGSHGRIHQNTDSELSDVVKNSQVSLKDAKLVAVRAHTMSFDPKCNPKCLKAQLDAAFKKMCKGNNAKLRGVDSQGDTVFSSEDSIWGKI